MPQSPDVTVVVIAHDVADELMACLESLEEHAEGLQLQTVVVDNGSRDGTAQLVRERFPQAELVVLEQNIGVPARNEGLRRARAPLRMFLDSDARLTAGALTTLVRALEERPRTGLVGPRLVDEHGRPQPSARRMPPLWLPLLRRPPLSRWGERSTPVRRHLMADAPLDRRRRVEYVLGAAQLFRAEAQQSAGEIDPRIFYGPDDADWCLRIRCAGWDVEFVPDAVVVHGYRRSTAGRPASRLALAHLRGFLHFQRTWWSRRAVLRAEGRAMDAEADAPRGRTPGS